MKLTHKLIYHIIFSILILICTIFIIVSPNTVLSSTRNSLTMWANIIVPSLFSFLIISELLNITGINTLIGRILTPIIQPILKLPGISSIAIVLGMTSGYPIGAKTTADLLKANKCTIDDANHLITFTNNSGPLFISGAIGIAIYQNTAIANLLLISHYTSAILVGLLFRFLKNKEKNTSSFDNSTIEIINFSKFSNILGEIIKRSLNTLFMLGGFIVIFAVFTSILDTLGILTVISNILFPKLDSYTANSLIYGLLEITTGITRLANSNLSLLFKIILTSFFIGFGGLSVHLQTLNILSDTKISTSRYFIGKTLQAIFSSIISFLLLRYTDFSNVLTQSVFSTEIYNSDGFLKFISVIIICFLFCVFYKIWELLREYK